MDTITKLRSLLNMKSTVLEDLLVDLRAAEALVEALRSDLLHAANLIRDKDEQIKTLQQLNYDLEMQRWEQQDADEEWLKDYLARHSDPIYQDIMAQDHTKKDDDVHLTHLFTEDDEVPF